MPLRKSKIRRIKRARGVNNPGRKTAKCTKEIVVEKEESLSEDGEVQDSETEEKIAAVEEVQEPEEIVEEKETEKSNDN